ncbi:MAG: hypothetical protein H7263_14555 [Candidatus Sericytochromatia bacterium]|nr:hypothetical protein [Candidatus Sericytochromatia bacterium]
MINSGNTNNIVLAKNPVTNFKTQLQLQGINLSNDETNKVVSLQHVKSSSQWAASDSGDANSNLENNFYSFSNSLNPNGPQTSNDYFNRAANYADSVNSYSKYYFDTEYYKKKQIVLLVKWDTQTREFIIIHFDGNISNYQKTNNLNSTRYVVVPDNIYTNFSTL